MGLTFLKKKIETGHFLKKFLGWGLLNQSVGGKYYCILLAKTNLSKLLQKGMTVQNLRKTVEKLQPVNID